MRTKFNVKNIEVNIVEYLFVIVIVLNCNTIWTSYEDTVLNKILKVAMVAVAALYFISYGEIGLGDLTKVIIFGIICVFYLIVYTIAVQYKPQSFLYLVIDALCIFFVVAIAKSKDGGYGILTKYVNFVVLLAVISLFFWLFGSTLGIIKSTGITYSTWTGNDELKAVPSYYSLYFETQITNGVIRNTGIFTEAPMYNFVLSIALLIELFYKKDTSYLKSLVVILTILTTISTTGWVLAIAAVLLKFIFNNKIKGVAAIIRGLIMPVMLIAAIVVIQILLSNRLNTSSGSVRLDDFAAGYKAWMTSPLFGSGIYNSDYVKQFMSSFRSNNLGFSNSPMEILYQGGIFLILPYLYFAVQWIWTCFKEKSLQKFLFFACFIFLFAITVTSYRFLTIFIFMASGLNDETKKKNLLNREKNQLNKNESEQNLNHHGVKSF